MKKRLSKISLGSANFGFDYGIHNKKKIKFNEVKKILNYANKIGICKIDTAQVYGDSEKVIGKYINKIETKWNITSKFNNLDLPLEDQLIISKRNLNIFPKNFIAHSAKLFKSEYFINIVRKFKNKYPKINIGVSIYSSKEIDEILNGPIKPDIIQLPISILDKRLYESKHLQEINKMNIKIQARSIFLQGLFFLDDNFIKKKFPSAYISILKLKDLSKKIDISISQLSLLWVLDLYEINEVILGIDSQKQLEENYETMKININPEIYNEIKNIKFNDTRVLNPQNWL